MKDFCSQNTYRDFTFLGEFVMVIHLNIPQKALSQDIVTVSLVDTDILTMLSCETEMEALFSSSRHLNNGL